MTYKELADVLAPLATEALATTESAGLANKPDDALQAAMNSGTYSRMFELSYSLTAALKAAVELSLREKA